MFTALAPTLFYFSVWELGIAGHELSLLATLSPILLNTQIVLDIASSRIGRTALYVVSYIGLAAYALGSPLVRLFAVMFANVAVSIGFAVDWSALVASVGYQGTRTVPSIVVFLTNTDICDIPVLGLGVILSSLSKHANHSNNPGTLGSIAGEIAINR